MTPTLAVRDWILMFRGSCELTLRLCDMRTYTLMKFEFQALDYEDTIRDWGCKASSSSGSIGCVHKNVARNRIATVSENMPSPKGLGGFPHFTPGSRPGLKQMPPCGLASVLIKPQRHMDCLLSTNHWPLATVFLRLDRQVLGDVLVLVFQLSQQSLVGKVHRARVFPVLMHDAMKTVNDVPIMHLDGKLAAAVEASRREIDGANNGADSVAEEQFGMKLEPLQPMHLNADIIQ